MPLWLAFAVLAAASPPPPGTATGNASSALMSQAAAACDQSTPALAVGGGASLSPPWLFLRKTADKPWTRYAPVHPGLKLTSASTVGGVVCIDETLKEETGRYTSGEPAFSRLWRLRVLHWPSGVAVAHEALISMPPERKLKPGPGIGQEAVAELKGWLDRLASQKAGTENVRTYAFDLVGSSTLLGENNLALSGDGRWLAAGGCNRSGLTLMRPCPELTLWRTDGTGEPRTLPSGRHVSHLAFSPDGSMLASVEERRILVWHTASGKEGFVFEQGGIGGLDFSPDSRRLAAAGVHGLFVWDLGDGAEKAKNAEAKGELSSISGAFPGERLRFSRDGAAILVRGPKSIDVWDAGDGHWMKTLDSHCQTVTDGWAVWCSPSPPRLVDVTGGLEIPLRIVEGRKWGNSTAVSRTARWVAYARESEPIIELDDTSGRQPLRLLTGHHGKVRTLQISADERWLASYGEDRTIRLWQLEPAPSSH